MGEDLRSIGIVLLASLLAAVVGIEREQEGKPAGFRTHMFIGGAAALLVTVGKSLPTAFGPSVADNLRVDPLRLLEAIIVGVSFIGAGTILKQTDERKVRNLTTAATLLFSAGLGVCVAVDRYLLAIGLVLIALLINVLMKKVEDRWLNS